MKSQKAQLSKKNLLLSSSSQTAEQAAFPWPWVCLLVAMTRRTRNSACVSKHAIKSRALGAAQECHTLLKTGGYGFKLAPVHDTVPGQIKYTKNFSAIVYCSSYFKPA